VAVLVWINGPFGVGKTASAYDLHRRLPGSIVCDPEHLGIGLHRMIPPALRTNYQDLAAWRAGVHEVLDLVARGHGGPVIVPMTVTDEGYLAQTIGRLRADGHDVRHFALLADRATVLRRIGRRSIGPARSRDPWAVGRLDDCLAALRGPAFADQVYTDGLTAPQVADAIARLAGLTVLADTDGPLRAALRRYGTTARNVRIR
jgi:AAA domain